MPNGFELYGVTAPLDNSHAPNDWRKLRSAGPQILRARSASAGSATRNQNARNDFLACAAEPLANALATIAALIAPALVPLNCSIAMVRLASSTSSTPQVYAPHEPPPCSASPIGFFTFRGVAAA